MKILSSNVANVTNVEALEMLRERHARREAERDVKRPRCAPAISRRAREVDATTALAESYIVKTPAGRQTVDQVAGCLGFLRGEGDDTARDLGLFPRERLQIANLAPTGAVVIHAIVDDCEDRLDEAGIDEVVALSRSMLGAVPAAPDAPPPGTG